MKRPGSVTYKLQIEGMLFAA